MNRFDKTEHDNNIEVANTQFQLTANPTPPSCTFTQHTEPFRFEGLGSFSIGIKATNPRGKLIKRNPNPNKIYSFSMQTNLQTGLDLSPTISTNTPQMSDTSLTPNNLTIECNPAYLDGYLCLTANTSVDLIQQHVARTYITTNKTTTAQLAVIHNNAFVRIGKDTSLDIIQSLKNCIVVLNPNLSEKQIDCIAACKDIRILIEPNSLSLFQKLPHTAQAYLKDELEPDLINQIKNIQTLVICGTLFSAGKLNKIKQFQFVSFQDMNRKTLQSYIANLPSHITGVDIPDYDHKTYKIIGKKKHIRSISVTTMNPNDSFAGLPHNIIELNINSSKVLPAQLRTIPPHVQVVSATTMSEEQMAALPSKIILSISELQDFNKIPPHITKQDISVAVKSVDDLRYLPKTTNTVKIDPSVAPEIITNLPAQIKKIIFTNLNIGLQLPAVPYDMKIEPQYPQVLKNTGKFLHKFIEQRKSLVSALLKKEPLKPTKKLVLPSQAQEADEQKALLDNEMQKQLEINNKRNALKTQFQSHSTPLKANANNVQIVILEQLLADLSSNKIRLHLTAWSEKDRQALYSEKKYKEYTAKLESLEIFLNNSYSELKELHKEIANKVELFNDEITKKNHELEQALLELDFSLAEQTIAYISTLRHDLMTLTSNAETLVSTCKQKSGDIPEICQTLLNTISGTERKLKKLALEEAKEAERVLKAEQLAQEKLEAKHKAKIQAQKNEKPALDKGELGLPNRSPSPTTLVTESHELSIPKSATRVPSINFDKNSETNTLTVNPTDSRLTPPINDRTTPSEALASTEILEQKTMSPESICSHFPKPTFAELSTKQKTFFLQKKSKLASEYTLPVIKLAISQHAAHKVHLFFKLLIACYGTKKHFSLPKDNTANSTNTVHSSMLPNLIETHTGKVFLQGTRFHTQLNARDNLPSYVVTFNNSLRFHYKELYLEIVNKVAQKEKTIVEGLQTFLNLLIAQVDSLEVKSAFAFHHGKDQFYADCLKEIIEQTLLGIRIALLNNKVDLNFINFHLSLSDEEIKACNNNPSLAEDIYAKYCKRVQNELDIEMRTNYAKTSEIVTCSMQQPQSTGFSNQSSPSLFAHPSLAQQSNVLFFSNRHLPSAPTHVSQQTIFQYKPN